RIAHQTVEVRLVFDGWSDPELTVLDNQIERRLDRLSAAFTSNVSDGPSSQRCILGTVDLDNKLIVPIRQPGPTAPVRCQLFFQPRPRRRILQEFDSARHPAVARPHW